MSVFLSSAHTSELAIGAGVWAQLLTDFEHLNFQHLLDKLFHGCDYFSIATGSLNAGQVLLI